MTVGREMGTRRGELFSWPLLRVGTREIMTAIPAGLVRRHKSRRSGPASPLLHGHSRAAVVDCGGSLSRYPGRPTVAEDSTFADLMRRVRAGDAAAAASLVRTYEPAIRRAVRVRLEDTR